MKAYVNGCIDPHFPDLGNSWKWVVNFTPWPLYTRGKSPRYPMDRKLGGLQTFWTHRDSNSDSYVVQHVASRYTDYAIPATTIRGEENTCSTLWTYWESEVGKSRLAQERSCGFTAARQLCIMKSRINIYIVTDIQIIGPSEHIFTLSGRCSYTRIGEYWFGPTTKLSWSAMRMPCDRAGSCSDVAILPRALPTVSFTIDLSSYR
jgi:hypothetical protein